jgi:hypothetical protein
VQLVAATNQGRDQWITAFLTAFKHCADKAYVPKPEDWSDKETEVRQKLLAKLKEQSKINVITITKQEVGESVHLLDTGDRYVGAKMAKGVQGNGKLLFDSPQGSRYEGQLLNYNMHGKGVYFHNTGTRYEGEFRFGLMHGRGMVTGVLDGAVTVGLFARGLQHGPGTTLLLDGSVVDGVWEAGICQTLVKRPSVPTDEQIHTITDNLMAVFTFPSEKNMKTRKAQVTIKDFGVMVTYKSNGAIARERTKRLVWDKAMKITARMPDELEMSP